MHRLAAAGLFLCASGASAARPPATAVLQMLNQTVVVYQDEGHRLRKPEHIRDRIERIVGWFDAHLQPKAVKPPR